MADNYLEEKYEQLLKRKEAEHKAKCRMWQKRLEEYRRRTGFGKESGSTDDVGHGEGSAGKPGNDAGRQNKPEQQRPY